MQLHETAVIEGVTVRRDTDPDENGLECWVFRQGGEWSPVLLRYDADLKEEVRRWLSRRADQ